MLIAVAAAAVAAVAWVYLLAWHGGFWRTDQRLPPPGPDPQSWLEVAAIVPARDEAAMLPQTLPTLLAQDYPGPFRVILVDDDSSDGTARIAAALGAAQIVAGLPTPAGWAGKVWAMEQGLQAAGSAAYILFTDADISYAPGVLTSLVRSAVNTRAALVSQMALLRVHSFWERVLMPAFVYFFAQLYPFRRVNGGRTAAAAGGCMLVQRAALTAAGGLERIRAARIDDIALSALLTAGAANPARAAGAAGAAGAANPARAAGAAGAAGAAEAAGVQCWLGLSTGVRSLRRYPRLADAWDMVARSAYTQLRCSPAALAATVLGLAWLYLLPPAALAAGLSAALAGVGGAGWLAAAGLAGWALMTVTFVPMLALYRLSALRAPALPLIAGLYTAMTLDSARRHRAGHGGAWKGRTIPARAPRR